MAGVDNRYHIRRWMGLLGTQVISDWVFFYKYSLDGDTTTPSGLYARLCHAFLV